MAATDSPAKRFKVTYNAMPGSYYDTMGRYGITDSEHPGMGVFCSGIKAATLARKIAREYNAR